MGVYSDVAKGYPGSVFEKSASARSRMKLSLYLGLASLALLARSGSLGGQARFDESILSDATESFLPSVSAGLRFQSDRSPLGWGGLDLSALPEVDEISVDLVLGTPAERSQWTCGVAEIDADGRRERLAIRYAGVPMEDGVYDAVSTRVSIETVRRMHAAERVEIRVCGTELDLSSAPRDALEEFVRRFDDIANYDGPSAPMPRPELGKEHEWEVSSPEEPDLPPTAA